MNLTAVIVLAVCFGAADGFFQPAFGGIVPLVVDTHVLPSASSWIGIARQGSAVLGPAIAGGLYGVAGPATVWAMEACSFVVSGGRLWLARPRRVQPEPQLGLRRELAVGFRYVISVPWIWTGIAAATVILMIAMAPYNALLPRIVRTHYHRGVGSYALLFSLMAAGMVVGSLVWATWHPRQQPRGHLLRRLRDQRPRDRRARALTVVPARGCRGDLARLLDRDRRSPPG